MSDTQATNVTPVETKAKKVITYTEVTLADGRKVSFPGSRKMQKSYEVTSDGVKATFDFVNGDTKSILISADSKLVGTLIGHGLVQKIGDETTSADSVEDMVLEVENIIARLNKGEWGTARKAGDSFAGAGVVIRALVEVTGLTIEQVKANIEKKLATTEGLTRAALYQSFRNPASKTGVVIARLEQEKLAKASKIDADAELAAWSA